MEQMEVLLNVPTISKTTNSSTPKSTVTDDDKSFADLYEQNINESKSSNTDATQKSAKKKDESVNNSAKSETKTDNNVDEKNTTKTDEAEETVEQNTVAVNWLNILALTEDSSNAENAEIVVDAEVQIVTNEDPQIISNEEVQITASEIDTQSINELSSVNESDGITESAAQTDEGMVFDENTENVEKTNANASVQTANVSAQISETTVDGITEETNDGEVVLNTVQNEVVAQANNVVAKQTTETNTVTSDFSTMMSDDIPQSNLQESVMTQIENSLGKIVKTGNNEIRIQLEPENLGVLNIRIIAGKDGTQVVFKADSHQSSQLIAGQTGTLKSMLNEAGIKVDQIVVNDFSFSQENYQDQQTFEQQNGKSNKFYKGTNGTDVQLETYDAGYELQQTIVGLNYLI